MYYLREEHKQHAMMRGFSLIELLIVMVIVAILARMAYPSYRTWILQSHRADALATLTQDQTIIERCYAQTFSYVAACAALPTFPQTSPQGYYTITVSNLTATTYTFTATPIGTQALDTTCATIRIDQTNNKTATNTSCWQP